MTTSSYHVLAQTSPIANTLTPSYTVPAGKQATISSIFICNENSITITFRICIQVNGAAYDVKQYLYFDLPVINNDTFTATTAITLNAGDVVNVSATSAHVAFSIFGVELT